MHLTTRNVNTAFRDLVSSFNVGTSDPKSNVVRRPSRNGPVLQCDDPVTITYTHPRERVLFNQVRDANPFFHLYESLWMLAGRNDVAPLAYYASNMANYSDDGETLNGAYGYRWRHAQTSLGDDSVGPDNFEFDQLYILINHLKADPASRRAVLQMWNVEDDLLKIGPGEGTSKDVCCNTAVYFSIRSGSPKFDEGKAGTVTVKSFLDMTVTNRSNDLIWGCLGANAVHFSFLQEYMAARIGVEVGRYNHFTNNLHVYESNWKPNEWLVSSNVTEGYGDMKGRSFIPLVKDPATFEQELPRFVERFSGKLPAEDLADDWKEPFLLDVAQPMLIAFACHKVRDYHGAFAGMEHIMADDWRIAATNWLTKRKENYERGQREAS